MKKVTIFILLVSLISFNVNAQDEDYVITKPSKPINKVFSSIPNPDFTSYFATSTAYTLKSRDIRLSNTDILYSKGSYGLTNNTMASVSISFAGTFIASIKQQIPINENLMLGLSASIGQLLSVPEDSMIFFGGGQTMITFGDIQNNITLGAGIYYAKSTFDVINEERDFLLNHVYIATQKQISRRIYIIAEGMYFWNYHVFSGAAGIKIIIKENMSLGFGIMPIAWIDPTINQSNIEANALPILTFRMFLDRH